MKTSGRIVTSETHLLLVNVEDFTSLSLFVAKMKEIREEFAVCKKQSSFEAMARRLFAKISLAFDSLYTFFATTLRATPFSHLG